MWISNYKQKECGKYFNKKKVFVTSISKRKTGWKYFSDKWINKKKKKTITDYSMEHQKELKHDDCHWIKIFFNLVYSKELKIIKLTP